MTSLAAAMALPAAARCDSVVTAAAVGGQKCARSICSWLAKTGLYSLMPRISRKSFLVKLVPGIEGAFLAFGDGLGRAQSKAERNHAQTVQRQSMAQSSGSSRFSYASTP